MILIRQFCSIPKIQQELIAKASETLSDSNTMASNYEVAFFLLFKNGGFSLLSLLYCFSHQNMILVLLCYLSKWRMVGEIKEKLKQLKMKFLSYFVRFYYIFAWHITPYITYVWMCKFLLLTAGGKKDSTRASDFKWIRHVIHCYCFITLIRTDV